MDLELILQKLTSQESLTAEESGNAIQAMMSGKADLELAKKTLLAWKAKGETAEELAGAASTMRSKMTRIRSGHQNLIDTCGTGGAGSGIFNVSTTAAILAAAAGFPVAKHGNRKVSSHSGSADVLSELGVNIEADASVVETCLNEIGLCFCFAQKLHPAMKNVAPIRQALGVPTVFNLLGPLCNPADAKFQLLGVGKPELQMLLAESLAKLGTKRAIILHSEDGLCEISNSAPTHVVLIEQGQLTRRSWHPADFGLNFSERSPIQINSPRESALLIREILAGAQGPARDIAVMNAAAASWLVTPSLSLPEATSLICKAIDSGKATKLLARLSELTSV